MVNKLENIKETEGKLLKIRLEIVEKEKEKKRKEKKRKEKKRKNC